MRFSRFREKDCYKCILVKELHTNLLWVLEGECEPSLTGVNAEGCHLLYHHHFINFSAITTFIYH